MQQPIRKVLLINGSPRKNGNTFIALSEVSKTLQQEGLETEIAWIGNNPMRGCIACNGCKRSETGHCVFDDDICNEMIDKMNASDALVVGSPVYCGVPTGQLLSLIQRMLHAGADVQYKPAAAVCVCRRGGATASFQTLQLPFQMFNMPIVTSQYWNIVYGREAGEAALDTEGMQVMRTLAHNMAWMLRSLHKEDIPVKEERQYMHFIRP